MKLDENPFSITPHGVKPLSCPVLLMILVMGLFLPGCRQVSSTAKTSDPTGTYTLVAINGNKLPYTPPHEGGAPPVQSSTLTLNTDGSFRSTMTYGMPGGKVVSRDFSGTYTREGSRIKLQWKGAGGTTATLEGTTFTMDNEGVLFTYRK